MWSDYVDFFDKLVKEEGMEKAINEYAFHPLIFPRLFERAFHPVIHLGYGVEFQIPMIVSEGFLYSLVCICLTFCFSTGEDRSSSKQLC